jgi:DNA-binding GntR family transcriptional regulator
MPRLRFTSFNHNRHLTYQLAISSSTAILVPTNGRSVQASGVAEVLELKLQPPYSPAGSLAEGAYRALEEMIVTRQLRPGSMLSENQLSEQLGCGRTPIREALQRLKFEGYVEIHPRRGVLVAPVDVLKQLELLEVRRPLERLVVRLAAARASDLERAEMRGLAKEIRAAAAAEQAVRYLQATRTIHETEARAAHNAALAATIGVIHGQSRRFWYAQIEASGAFPEGSEIHAATLGAIIDGDGEAAAVSADRLLDHLERLTRRALDRHKMP